MGSFHESVVEYKKQLGKGTIREAYRGLMEYILGLRTYFQKKYPGYFVSNNIYVGYMDMTYFAINPKTLKDRNLKVALVFIHETCRFEAWLSGTNKQVQTKYWKLIKESGWDQYHLIPTTKGADSIVEYILVEDPDFNDLDALTKEIERQTSIFIKDIETFLSQK